MDQVLYRKYRPISLEEMVGQEPIVKTLKASLEKGVLGHALLLTGPRGVGKTSLARLVAHAVNGVEYKLNQTPLDIIEIDAASSGRIDEVRDLREKLKFLPVELKYKVYIIDEVHMLTKESFNALLKTLEEPPDHIIFILATTEFHKVPSTITSRCQCFTFKLVSEEVLLTHLSAIAKKEKLKISQAALGLIVTQAQGSFRDALSLLDQISALASPIDEKLVAEVLGLPDHVAIDKLLQALSQRQLAQVIKIYQGLIDKGIDAVVLARELSRQIRHNFANDNLQEVALHLDLLEDLLTINQAQQPQFALEIVLLKHAQKF